MLSRLLQQLLASIGVVFRTVRAFVTRTSSSMVARLKSATSLTRQVAKLVPVALKKVATIGKKPTKREDYIETKQMFIAKSFLLTAAIVTIASVALIYWVGWPWLVSRFFTAKLWCEDPVVAEYTGRVTLYYEETKENIYFEGKLEEGVIQGKGKTFDENGLQVYIGEYTDGIYHGEGKFFTDGALTYEGTFAEGLYEGEGKLYGAGEALIYEGTFVDGLYDGTGKLYAAEETLQYEGTFAAGRYEGAGKLYRAGKLLYDGTFAEGLYEGAGKLYNTSGLLIYEGNFTENRRNGEGIAYVNGNKRYKGTFENELYHGTGTMYDHTGRILYEGSFVNGAYHGEGTLFLSDGITVEGTFEVGKVLGTAKYSVAGKLCYEGDLVHLMPEGTGVVYGSDELPLYTGLMRNGAIDGGALLGAAADEIRTMLEGKGKETVNDTGFAITSEALGLTVFCSFAQEDTPPTAYYVYLYEPEDSIPSMLWESAVEFETAASNDADALLRSKEDMAKTDFPVAIPAALGSDAYCRTYYYPGYTMRLWSRSKTSEPLLAEWKLDASLPSVSRESMDVTGGSTGRLEELVEQLGLSLSGGATGSHTTEENPYYGSTDAGKLLAAASKKDRTAVVTAALDYLEYAERRVAVEENLALCQILLKEEQQRVDLGTGDELHLSALEDKAAQLEVDRMKCVVQMRKDSRTIEDATGKSVDGFDLQTLPLLFDVTKLDAAALGEEAVALAMENAVQAAEKVAQKAAQAAEEAARAAAEAAKNQASAAEETISDEETPSAENTPAAETATSDESAPVPEPTQPEPVQPIQPTIEIEVEPVDTKAILQSVEDSILELELLRQDVQLALREYETASAAAEKLAQEYAIGMVTNAERMEAQMTANEQRAAIYTATANFARHAAALNELTGGLLAKIVGWMPEVLGN